MNASIFITDANLAALKDRSEERSIDLAGERKISFRARGQTLIYTFRRILNEDWLRYFGLVTVESERDGEETVQRIDIRGAAVELVERTLLNVQGYAGSLPEKWQEKLLPGHKQQAADLLTDVQPSKLMQAIPFSVSDSEEIVLRAAWGVEDGNQLYFDELRHFIAPPSAEHRRVYNRSMSETRVAGSRTGRTIYRSSAPILIRLYDELVQRVDGYTVNGQPLGSDTAAIRKEMDCYHKVSAMKQMFASPDEGMEVASAA